MVAVVVAVVGAEVGKVVVGGLEGRKAVVVAGAAVVGSTAAAAVEEGGRAREGGEAYVAGGRHHGSRAVVFDLSSRKAVPLFSRGFAAVGPSR